LLERQDSTARFGSRHNIQTKYARPIRDIFRTIACRWQADSAKPEDGHKFFLAKDRCHQTASRAESGFEPCGSETGFGKFCLSGSRLTSRVVFDVPFPSPPMLFFVMAMAVNHGQGKKDREAD
jgi:hypothetical protein